MPFYRCLNKQPEKITPFSRFYEYTSLPAGEIKAAYVMRNLFGAAAHENWVHLAIGDNPFIYYNTTNGTINRGNRWTINGYLPTIYTDLVFESSTTKMNVPTFVNYNNIGSYSISISDLSKYIYFRTVDILDQNGNIILPKNCTLADLGIEV